MNYFGRMEVGNMFSDTADNDLLKNTTDFEWDYNDTDETVIPDKFNSSEEVMDVEDGFNITKNVCGHIDLYFWSRITGASKDELIDMYEGELIWQKPKEYQSEDDRYTDWYIKEEYLKGNIIKKYNEACAFNYKTGMFGANINLLRDNFPEKVAPEDIHITIGATWVPKEYVVMFVKQLLNMVSYPRIEFLENIGKWDIKCDNNPGRVYNYSKYGTERMSAIKIIYHMLNAIPIKVYDQVENYETGKVESVLNREETLFCLEKQALIDEEWQNYIHGDRLFEEMLQEEFMQHYGYTVSRFDGSYLRLPGMNPDIILHKHQKDVIAHVIAHPNVYVAHDVGSGKTYGYSGSIHEILRLRLCNKALVVVPNTTLVDAAEAYNKMYPDDEILVIYPRKHFSTANRNETLKLIKEGNHKVVFMAYSSFDMITMSKKYAFKRVDDNIIEARKWMSEAKSYNEKYRYELYVKKLEKDAKKYKENFKDTETACFDTLGFDMLVVDEAHNYKNISLDYNGGDIVGFHAKGSKKADAMLEKVEYIQSVKGRVIFASGTPITNSLADLYVIQRYLQPEELKLCNVFYFNEWLATFAEREHSFEIDVDSSNFRFTTRFSKFHNLPELMSMFSDVCDFYQTKPGELGLPKFNGYTEIVVKRSDEQKEYIENLAKRTDDIRNRRVKCKEDNLLKVTVQGRMAALDIRLVDPRVVRQSCPNKVERCADEVARIYWDNPGTTQIIFCDISTPKKEFNVYDAMKEELLFRGLQPEEVAYIHDAQSEKERSKIEDKFNNGEIRVLIGSTQKLGTGTNVQDRLLAIHHLDVPWKPSDMVQREGRIIRQGNTNPEVFIYRYVTEASFDAYTYQILQNKQNFISQFLSGSLSTLHREETDCADTVLSFAEIKALAIGNKLIKERVETSNMLERAKINQRQKRKELNKLEDLISDFPRRIDARKRLISNTELDIKYYDKHKTKVTKDERNSFGEELFEALKDNGERDSDRVFDEYQGFSILLPKYMKLEEPHVIVTREGSNRYDVKMDGESNIGCSRRIDYVLEHLPETLKRHKMELESLYAQQSQAITDYEKGNDYDEEVKTLSDRIAEIDEELKGCGK